MLLINTINKSFALQFSLIKRLYVPFSQSGTNKCFEHFYLEPPKCLNVQLFLKIDSLKNNLNPNHTNRLKFASKVAKNRSKVLFIQILNVFKMAPIFVQFFHFLAQNVCLFVEEKSG